MSLTSKNIALGSGFLYVVAATRAADGTVTIPADSTLEVEGNLLGHIKNGCTVTYTPTFYTAKDDMELVEKEIITSEEVVLKSGVMTWVPETLAKLSATGSATHTDPTSSTEGSDEVKIGGLKNAQIKEYVVRFVHSDGDKKVTIVGVPDSGFELAFQKEAETVVDATFKAKPIDATGHKLFYKEVIPATGA